MVIDALVTTTADVGEKEGNEAEYPSLLFCHKRFRTRPILFVLTGLDLSRYFAGIFICPLAPLFCRMSHNTFIPCETAIRSVSLVASYGSFHMVCI